MNTIISAITAAAQTGSFSDRMNHDQNFAIIFLAVIIIAAIIIIKLAQKHGYKDMDKDLEYMTGYIPPMPGEHIDDLDRLAMRNRKRIKEKYENKTNGDKENEEDK